MADSDLREWYLRYADALNRHQWEEVHEFIHDTVQAYGVTYTRDEVIANFRAIGDAVPDMHWEVTEMVFDGDGIAARAVNTGTPIMEWLGVPATGKSFEITEIVIYKVSGGKFVQMMNMHDSAELRRQLS